MNRMFTCYIKKTLFFSTLLISIFVLPLYSQTSNEEDFRGIWVVRNNLVSKEKIDRVINIAYENGFNNLIVQVRGRGEAYYKSKIVPVAEEIKSKIDSFDPLQYFIAEAHKRNIKIHCWFNVCLLWSSPDKPKDKNHLFYRKPEWFSASYNLPDKNSNNSESTADLLYLSPGVDEFRYYIVKVIEEVIHNYNVDGVHLDYIRYPGKNFGYNKVLRNKFYSKNKIDPLELIRNQEDVIENINEEAFYNLLERWNNFRAEQVNLLVKNIKICINKRNPSILLSTAVVPDLNRAKKIFYQFWSDWANQDWVDFVIPMNYTVSREDFKDNITLMLKYVPNKKIVMGISADNQSKYKLASKVYLSKSRGIKDICIFSFDSINNSIDKIKLF